MLSNKKVLEYLFVPKDDYEKVDPIWQDGLFNSATQPTGLATGEGIVTVEDRNTKAAADPTQLSNITPTDEFRVLMGTANAQNSGRIDSWAQSMPRVFKTPWFKAGNIIEVSSDIDWGAGALKEPAKTVGRASGALFKPGAITVPAGEVREFALYTDLRSVRKDRDYGYNVDQQPIFARVEARGSDVTSAENLIAQQMIERAYRASKASNFADTPGNKEFVLVAVTPNAGGPGSTTATAGTNIAITDNRPDQELTLDVTPAMVNALTELGVDLLPFDYNALATANTDLHLLLLSLEESTSKAYDSIYATQVDVSRSEIGRDFELYDSEKVGTVTPIERTALARNWKIRYEERPFGQTGSLELQNLSDELLPGASSAYLIDKQYYGFAAIDIYQQVVVHGQGSNALEQQERIWFLFEVDEAGAVQGTTTNFQELFKAIADLDWVKSSL